MSAAVVASSARGAGAERDYLLVLNGTVAEVPAAEVLLTAAPTEAATFVLPASTSVPTLALPAPTSLPAPAPTDPGAESSP
eukprot:CAMPEP_0119293878 /NCGR_PEP_ID=MMETSP1329-20130426/46857_1 /TAXON_ID=114041 /ORGANISM="Genus nov. species nov., Strain RCC1024" /LENGTH=80 /DNA_ID=CAMNT_0007294749 /DNA_START=22 /DNA_END=261 /DNA_ORIENTATION=-